MKELSDTYDNCIGMVGKEDETGTILLPVAHSTQNAQVEVVIDLSGNFIRAEEIPKSDAITIIPVTEDSGTRSSGIAPHPLFDKLIYVAGDYSKYYNKNSSEEYHSKYIQELEKWCDSEWGHDKIKAVFLYLKRACLISDLISSKIITQDETGSIDDKKKVQNIAAADLFVRFRIADFDLEDEGALWKDKSIYQSYINYIMSNQDNVDLCFVSGEFASCSYKHPAKVRHAADKAKLISSNDEYGFTYRGRFAEKEQALSVGYLVSQKAHNALRWLIDRQGHKGYNKNGLSMVVWEKNDKKLPNILDDTRKVVIDYGLMDMDEDTDIGYSYAKRFNSAIDGYRIQLDTMAAIHILSLDAATTGRLSVNYYRVLNGSDFLDRLKYWHETCIWEHEYWKEDKTKGTYIGTPRTMDIVLAAFGTEQNGRLVVKDELMRATIERLLPCILDKRDLPKDIIRAAINNVSRPMAMEQYNWIRVLNITCALIKKDKNYEVEDWVMALDNEEKDRSYLYGRLLAVADRIEYLTYQKGEKRQTNAKRYMQQFRNRPFTTWMIIENSIRPYFGKFKFSGQSIKYENLLHELHDMFSTSDYINNNPLDGMYLLGFHCQAKAFNNKESNDNNNNNEEVEENE